MECGNDKIKSILETIRQLVVRKSEELQKYQVQNIRIAELANEKGLAKKSLSLNFCHMVETKLYRLNPQGFIEQRFSGN